MKKRYFFREASIKSSSRNIIAIYTSSDLKLKTVLQTGRWIAHNYLIYHPVKIHVNWIVNSLEGHLFSTNRNEFFFSFLTSCTIENALVWYIRSLFSPSPVSYKIDLADISSEILTIKIFLIRVKIERRKKSRNLLRQIPRNFSLFSSRSAADRWRRGRIFQTRKPRKLFSRFSIKLRVLRTPPLK